MGELNPDLSALQRRVSALERQNARLQRAALGAASALILMVVMGQAGPRNRPGQAGERRSVDAERFIVRDGAGQVRAVLGMNDAGGVGLSLNGLNRIQIGVGLDGAAGLQIIDAENKRRAGLALSADTAVGLEMDGPLHAARLRLRVGADGTPSLRLLDKDTKDGAVLTVLPDWAGLLVGEAGQGRTRGAFAASGDGSASLDFFDGKDKSRLSLLAKSDGSPSVTLLGDRGEALFKAPAPK
jgi:hypothetical protein